jgi:hypothetical protein
MWVCHLEDKRKGGVLTWRNWPSTAAINPLPSSVLIHDIGHEKKQKESGWRGRWRGRRIKQPLLASITLFLVAITNRDDMATEHIRWAFVNAALLLPFVAS